jgi:hypothetical protein
MALHEIRLARRLRGGKSHLRPACNRHAYYEHAAIDERRPCEWHASFAGNLLMRDERHGSGGRHALDAPLDGVHLSMCFSPFGRSGMNHSSSHPGATSSIHGRERGESSRPPSRTAMHARTTMVFDYLHAHAASLRFHAVPRAMQPGQQRRASASFAFRAAQAHPTLNTACTFTWGGERAHQRRRRVKLRQSFRPCTSLGGCSPYQHHPV